MIEKLLDRVQGGISVQSATPLEQIAGEMQDEDDSSAKIDMRQQFMSAFERFHSDSQVVFDEKSEREVRSDGEGNG
jgi:hypothetical protein